jgi:hypothetical protein
MTYQQCSTWVINVPKGEEIFDESIAYISLNLTKKSINLQTLNKKGQFMNN